MDLNKRFGVPYDNRLRFFVECPNCYAKSCLAMSMCFCGDLKTNITEMQQNLSLSIDAQDGQFASGRFAYEGAGEMYQKHRGLAENLVRCGYENPHTLILTIEVLKNVCPEHVQALIYWAGVDSLAEEFPALRRLVEIRMIAGAGFLVRSGQLKALAE